MSIPLNERQKAHIRRSKGLKKPWSLDSEPHPVKKVREYLAPVDLHFVPSKPRGRSGCRLSHEKRLLLLEKATRRAAWFAELGVRV